MRSITMEYDAIIIMSIIPIATSQQRSQSENKNRDMDNNNNNNNNNTSNSHENLQTKSNPNVYCEEKTNSSSLHCEETNLQTIQGGGTECRDSN